MNKEEIISKAMEIIDKTKDDQEKYKNERKLIFKYLNSNGEDIEELESIISIYEKINHLESETKKYEQVKELVSKIKEQHTRRVDDNDEKNHIHLFFVLDKNGEKYEFFTRENANNYIEQNKELFAENQEINVNVIKSGDLEKLIEIIEK